MATAHIEVDTSQLEINLAQVFAKAGPAAPGAIRRAINRTGDMATTQMVRALTSQTGLKRAVIVRALHKLKAGLGSLSYTIRSRGGNVSLKYFKARETGKGVSAAPWGGRRVYAGSFIKGGLFPNRVAIPRLNGQVFMRTGSARMPIVKVKSGLFIPTEMVKGATASAFLSTVSAVLPARLAHELDRLLGGHA